MNSTSRVYHLCITRMSLIGVHGIDIMERYVADMQNFQGLFDLNIMMNGTNMFPGGFHPIAQFLEPSGRYSARYKLRANVSVKYYFIDFGLSTHFPDTVSHGLSQGPAVRTGRLQSCRKLIHMILLRLTSFCWEMCIVLCS